MSVMTEPETLGDWLRELRRRRGEKAGNPMRPMTQGQLARSLGVHRVTVAHWEDGTYRPLPIFLKTLTYLGRDVGLEPPPKEDTDG